MQVLCSREVPTTGIVYPSRGTRTIYDLVACFNRGYGDVFEYFYRRNAHGIRKPGGSIFLWPMSIMGAHSLTVVMITIIMNCLML